MAGHVYRHGKGWQAVVIDGYGRNAKREVVGSFRTRELALNELRIAEAEVLTGVFVDRQLGKVPLADRMAADIERRTDRAHNTTVSAENALMHVKRFFGTRSIAAIKHSDVQAFVSSLDLAPTTVKTVFGHLQATIRQAMADGVVGRDPTVKIKLPKVPGKDMVIPTDRDVERLHGSAPAGFAGAVVLGAGVGMRAQECAGLATGDIDFLRRTVHVHRQWHARLNRFEDVKTSGSDRYVPVGDEILDVLAAHIGTYGTGDHDLILHADGTPLNSGMFRHRWLTTLKAAGVETLRFHSLRHHFSSTAISAGVPLPALSKALGHSKPSVTLDVYGWLMVGDDDRLRDAPTVRFGRTGTA